MWALNVRKFNQLKKVLGVTNIDLAKICDVSAPTLSCWASRRQNVAQKTKADSLITALQAVSKRKGYKPAMDLQFGDLYYSVVPKRKGAKAKPKRVVKKFKVKTKQIVNGSGVTTEDITSVACDLDHARETLLLAMASAEELDEDALTIYRDLSAIRKSVKELGN